MPSNAPSSTKREIGLEQVRKLYAVLNEFETLLDKTNVHEKKDIHPFIYEHSFILHPNPEEVFSEVQIGLGTEYQLDFLVREADGKYIIVEIENPRHRIFNKDGYFSSAVNHGLSQIEDWQEWIENNLSTVQKRFAEMSSPRGILIIGRSKYFTEEESRRLARRNINSRGRLEILTYDHLIANARAFISSIEKNLQF